MPVTFTQDQLDFWTAEAEAGYDVDELKKRGRGRPGRGAAPSHVVTVRLTADELARIDQAAQARQVSRSELMRQALDQLITA